MKNIFAKFRHVTRYVVAVFLAVAFCFSAFADCTVRWSESEGGWWIDCHFGDSTFVPAQGGGGAGGGSCTNCTAMTPAECAAAKAEIKDEISRLQPILFEVAYENQRVITLLEDSRDAVSMLLAEGERFVKVSTSGSIPKNTEGEAARVTPQDDFFASDLTYSGLYRVGARVGSANGIYNYYNDRLAPVLSPLLDELVEAQNLASAVTNSISDVSSTLSVLDQVADGMNCTACEGSGSGGGGGGGTPGGGTTPSGCPCSELINAVKTSVDNCKTELEDINSKVGSIARYVSEWDYYIKQIEDDVHRIRQTTDRMDDFYRDDTEFNFKKLIEHTLTLSNAVFSATVKLPPNLYWTEYTNATQFLTAEGSSFDWLQKGKTIEAGADGSVIDFGEYGQLNWFQRMEFLLGHIAGIFSPTNSTNADFSSKEKEKAEEAKDAFDGLTFDDEKSVLNQMVQYVENIEDSLNPFHGVFDHSSGSTRSITFLPDVSVENELLGNTMPSITLDLTESGSGPFSISDLVDLAHNLTTFLWLVSFLIIDVLAIIKFVQCLIALNRWYWKIYNSWVSTMFSGGGR